MNQDVLDQNSAIRTIRRSYPTYAQRTLATKIVSGDFNGVGGLRNGQSRTFASVYGIIRRHDNLKEQVKEAKASSSVGFC